MVAVFCSISILGAFEHFDILCRVARWHIFKPKIPIWVNFGAIGNEDVGIFYCHHIGPFGVFCGNFGIFYGYLVYFSRFGM
jgi:hypothetical protein